MRFKEIEKSLYSKHSHELQIQRLQSRIEQIKNSKSKHASSNQEKENFLPRITKRNMSKDVVKNRQFELQNSRLIKKLQETKNGQSRYFNEVIGVNVEEVIKKSKKKTRKTKKSKVNNPMEEESSVRNTEAKSEGQK